MDLSLKRFQNTFKSVQTRVALIIRCRKDLRLNAVNIRYNDRLLLSNKRKIIAVYISPAARSYIVKACSHRDEGKQI